VRLTVTYCGILGTGKGYPEYLHICMKFVIYVLRHNIISLKKHNSNIMPPKTVIKNFIMPNLIRTVRY